MRAARCSSGIGQRAIAEVSEPAVIFCKSVTGHAWHAARWGDGLLNRFDRPKARTTLRAFFYFKSPLHRGVS